MISVAKMSVLSAVSFTRNGATAILTTSVQAAIGASRLCGAKANETRSSTPPITMPVMPTRYSGP
eukprot:SAG22_NODE_11168_length_497_cov_1.032663_1_plen_64_part_10